MSIQNGLDLVGEYVYHRTDVVHTSLGLFQSRPLGGPGFFQHDGVYQGAGLGAAGGSPGFAYGGGPGDGWEHRSGLFRAGQGGTRRKPPVDVREHLTCFTK